MICYLETPERPNGTASISGSVRTVLPGVVRSDVARSHGRIQQGAGICRNRISLRLFLLLDYGSVTARQRSMVKGTVCNEDPQGRMHRTAIEPR